MNDSMLDTLRRIVQEVSSAHDLDSVLEIIVSRIGTSMGAEVCSVYLFDRENQRYVLMSTRGLNDKAVGRVSLGYSEGIVGLVGSREEPVNIDDASNHPKFRYLAETGEEDYNAFLGVPIIHHGNVMGVLVVQQRAKRRFGGGEEAFLVTISAQLAGVIAHAEATGVIASLSKGRRSRKASETRVSGVPGAPGVAIGTAMVISSAVDLDNLPDRECRDPDLEVRKFNQALDVVRKDIKQVGEKLSADLRPEEQALFDVYLHMLDDNALGAEVIRRIHQGQWAQGALKDVVSNYVQHFELLEDDYMRHRSSDIKDLGRRVLAHLQERDLRRDDIPDNAILVSDEVMPSMLGEVPTGKLAGLVSVKGSANSHVAILARAMGIPTIMGVLDLPYSQLEGQELIVDGYRGSLYINPSRKLRQQYQDIVKEECQLVKGLEALKNEPSETRDNHRIPLCVNTGLYTDVVRSLDRGAEGVGLYRTEVPFMMKERFPSEKEQEEIYRQQLKAFCPKPVTMRTLDIGGDKSLPYFPITEDNPFLGWRGIRITLDHPEVFLVQVRAMLKASEGFNNLRIMLPMVSSIAEVDSAQHLIYRAFNELLEEGVSVNMPQIGVMIEVPGAVYQVKDYASMVEFLSVGSNDLTQYLLAVDRNNPRVANLYNSFHPAVLHALQKIVKDAHSLGCPVSVCGELAGDPGGALLLMAMGYDSLSMNAANLPRVKSVIRSVTKPWAEELLQKVMSLDQASVIRSTVDLALQKIGASRLIRPQG